MTLSDGDKAEIKKLARDCEKGNKKGESRRGAIEWLALIVPLLISVGAVAATGLNYYGGYVKLKSDFESKCEKFTEGIKRIQDEGTVVSKANDKKIAVLETNLVNITEQLRSIQSDQKETVRLLTGLLQNQKVTMNSD